MTPSRYGRYLVQRRVRLGPDDEVWVDVAPPLDEATAALVRDRQRDPDNTRIEPVDPQYERADDGQYVVRLYDGMDGLWIDVGGPFDEAAALALWEEKTDRGNHHVCFGEIDYYAIFPASTRMLRSTEAGYDPDIGDWPGNKTPGEA